MVAISFGMRKKWRPPGLGEHDLARLAKRQHGVVSVRQLRGPLGYSEAAIHRALRAGRLHRIYTGVYAVGHTNLSERACCLAAVLACGPNAVLSHYSAAWLWGLRKGSPAPYEVTGPIPRRRKPPRIVVHRTRRLPPDDWTVEDNIPVSSVARVQLDLATRDRRTKRYMERADELGLLDLRAIHDLLDRTRGHHGWGRLRRAAAFYAPPPFTRSGFERRFLEAALAAGLPRPSANFNVAGYELDLYWAEQRFCVELDTFGTHGTQAAFERDRERSEELLVHGIAMTRVTDRRFAREPEAVIARVARLLAERS